jgi:hypothetical protein
MDMAATGGQMVNRDHPIVIGGGHDELVAGIPAGADL